MDLNLTKYGLQIKEGNISFEMRDEKLIEILIKMRHDEYWNEKLQRIAKVDKDSAICNGQCEFPIDCKSWMSCTKKMCNYDTCSNGYCFRWS